MHRFNLSTWALEHRPLVVLILLLVSLAGILSYRRLAQSEDPKRIIAAVALIFGTETVAAATNVVRVGLSIKEKKVHRVF